MAGYAYDTLGNYELVLQTLVVTLLLAAALALALPPSRRASSNTCTGVKS
ncbi:MAG: hypothetical protein KDI14_02940 [Halioglobus sp.]|nr:hypothetical protein [Halioglobus sp.]